jgi:hypothetical protein
MQKAEKCFIILLVKRKGELPYLEGSEEKEISILKML